MPSPAPVTSDDLHRVLDDLGVAVRASKSGFCVATVDGTEIRIPLPHKKRVVDKVTLGRLARACGADSYSDLLASLLNREPVKAGRPSQPEHVDSGPSKNDVRHACAVLRSRLSALDDWLRAGTHSPATYARILSDVTLATRSLSAWPVADGGWAPPDDSKFRPSRPDSVLTGAARATGITAKAVRRRDGVTKWQHEEMETT